LITSHAVTHLKPGSWLIIRSIARADAISIV